MVIVLHKLSMWGSVLHCNLDLILQLWGQRSVRALPLWPLCLNFWASTLQWISIRNKKKKNKHLSLLRKQAGRKKWKAPCQKVKGYVTFSAHGGVNPKHECRGQSKRCLFPPYYRQKKYIVICIICTYCLVSHNKHISWLF